MSDAMAVDWASRPAPKSKAELQAAITQMFAEMERMNARMDRSRVEIDRLAEETRATLDNISRLLAT